MNVAQQILQENPGLAEEMVMDFMAKKRIAEAAKFKEPTDFNVQDNPKLRAFQAYPRLMYDWKGRTTQEAGNQHEHEALLAAGWKEKPWPVDMLDPGFAPTAVDSGDIDERFVSLENRMLSLEQMIGEFLEKATKPKKAEAVKA